MKTRFSARNLALLGILGALALLMSFLENLLLPDLPLLPPGAKLGLSNIITTLTGALLGGPAAFLITALKALFAFVTRGATAGLMSACGGVLSTLGLVLLLRQQGRTLTFLGISVLCAALHNLGQLFCAAALTGTVSMLNYGKYLLLFSLFTGTLTGVMLNVLMPRLMQVLLKGEERL
ncbi:MAG: Gx transporter family protein [Clostridia bacterium]|nr:Gx transporter family protein [Clostridia bacterium]